LVLEAHRLLLVL
jgi:hypothetical protein